MTTACGEYQNRLQGYEPPATKNADLCIAELEENNPGKVYGKFWDITGGVYDSPSESWVVRELKGCINGTMDKKEVAEQCFVRRIERNPDDSFELVRVQKRTIQGGGIEEVSGVLSGVWRVIKTTIE